MRTSSSGRSGTTRPWPKSKPGSLPTFPHNQPSLAVSINPQASGGGPYIVHVSYLQTSFPAIVRTTQERDGFGCFANRSIRVERRRPGQRLHRQAQAPADPHRYSSSSLLAAVAHGPAGNGIRVHLRLHSNVWHPAGLPRVRSAQRPDRRHFRRPEIFQQVLPVPAVRQPDAQHHQHQPVDPRDGFHLPDHPGPAHQPARFQEDQGLRADHHLHAALHLHRGHRLDDQHLPEPDFRLHRPLPQRGRQEHPG